jgi:hypothetical protein
MKPHDRRPESGMRDRWMVSYMDVLTILLIFFIAVAAKSLMPPKSPPAVVPAAVVPAVVVPAVVAPLAIAPPAPPRVEEHAGLLEVQQKLGSRVWMRGWI